MERKKKNRVSPLSQKPSKGISNWCNTTGLTTYFLQELPLKEKKLISDLDILPRRWGYREGKEGQHAGYEEKLHRSENTDLYRVTDLTDVLFRTLSDQVARRGDYVSKLQNTQYVLETLKDNPSLLQKVSTFLDSFLTENPDVATKLQTLAQVRVETNSLNPWLVALVITSRIFLLLAKNQIQPAIVQLKKYNLCIESHLD